MNFGDLLRALSFFDAPDDAHRVGFVDPLVQTGRYIAGRGSEEELLHSILQAPNAPQIVGERVGQALAGGQAYEPVQSYGMAGDIGAGLTNPLNFVDMGLGLLASPVRRALGAVATRGGTVEDMVPFLRILDDVRQRAARGQDVTDFRGGYEGPTFLGRNKSNQILVPQSEALQAGLLRTPQDVRNNMTEALRPKFDEVYGRVSQNFPQARQWIERGIREGGHQWYRMDDILASAVEATGSPEEGRALFEFLMNIQGIASSGSDPVLQNRRANAIFEMLHNPEARRMFAESLQFEGGKLVSGGEEFMSFLQSGSNANPMARTGMYPTVRDFVNEGQLPFESQRNFKVPTFTENSKGQFTNATIDRHAVRALLGTSERIGPPNDPATYAAMEAAIIQLGNEFGLSPADAQAALWVGARDFTGVRGTDLFSQIFMGGAAQKAKELGTTVTDVLNRFWRGELTMGAVVGDDNARMVERALARSMGADDSDEPITYEMPGYTTGGRF